MSLLLRFHCQELVMWLYFSAKDAGTCSSVCAASWGNALFCGGAAGSTLSGRWEKVSATLSHGRGYLYICGINEQEGHLFRLPAGRKNHHQDDGSSLRIRAHLAFWKKGIMPITVLHGVQVQHVFQVQVRLSKARTSIGTEWQHTLAVGKRKLRIIL